MASGTSFALPSPMPTWPDPSPTTTSAVKENRRPPFTTLATRLMATTRSFSSSEPGSMRASAISSPFLESQPGGSRRIRQCLHAAVVLVSGPVEHDPLDPLFLGLAGDQVADGLGGRHVAAGLGRPLQLLREAARGQQRGLPLVVHDLGVDVLEAPEDHQAGPRAGAADDLADPAMPDRSPLFSRLGAHLLALATWRRPCRPSCARSRPRIGHPSPCRSRGVEARASGRRSAR